MTVADEPAARICHAAQSPVGQGRCAEVRTLASCQLEVQILHLRRRLELAEARWWESGCFLDRADADRLRIELQDLVARRSVHA